MILLVGSWLAWTQAAQEAVVDVSRSADAAAEYASRTFDGTSLLSEQVDFVLGASSDEQIREREQELHAALKQMIGARPSILTLYAIDKAGMPLVSANVYPVPRNRGVADRDFFTALRDSDRPSFVSSVGVGRFDDQLFFSVAHRRGRTSSRLSQVVRFDGLVLASIKPNEVGASLRKFATDSGDVVQMVREDGAVLASTEVFDAPPGWIDAGSGLASALSTGVPEGVLKQAEPAGSGVQLVAFRRVEGWPVYTVVTRPQRTVLAHVATVVAWQGALGIPASIGLGAMVAFGLRRSREVSEARWSLRIKESEAAASASLRDQERAYNARLVELQNDLMHVSRVSVAGELASGLAHELNQPLLAIVSALGAARQILTKGAAAVERDQQACEIIARASSEAMRAGEVLRSLRDFLRPGATNMRPEPLASLIEDTCKLVSPALQKQNVGLEIRVGANAPPVMVDRVQIGQVLLNLIRNAAEAMTAAGSRGERMLVTITAQAQDDRMVAISVADTGPGLSPDIAGRQFSPFLTTKTDGMGVGLSICRTIIEAHGGRIWAETNPGKGAVFTFTVPSTQRLAHA